MMNILKKVAFVLVIFTSGFVAALNLALLIPHSAEYEASWTKVAICIVMGIVGAVMLCGEKRR
jgi:hypothetical protein